MQRRAVHKIAISTAADYLGEAVACHIYGWDLRIGPEAAKGKDADRDASVGDQLTLIS